MAGRGGHAIGATVDTSVQVKKSEAGPATTAKGNACAGVSTAMQTCTWAGGHA
jgi:hypothetical protein